MKNPLKLSMDEIEDWEEFQDLVQAFFEELGKKEDNQITAVCAKKTGRGSDRGRDILVEMQLDDGIRAFKRTWVIACKFEEKSIGLSSIANSSLIDLLDSYNADGYLLISKSRVTAQLSQRLEELEQKDKHHRCFVYWEGPKFCTLLLDFVELIKKYFPQYHAATQTARDSAGIDNLLQE